MRTRLTAAFALLALLAAACSGASQSPTPDVQPVAPTAQHRGTVRTAATGNVVLDPGFESGGFNAGWTSCGTVASKVATAKAHSGTHSALNGTTAKPEINGTAGVCQTIVVPPLATLSFWVYEGTTDTIAYVDQEADLLSTSGANITTFYKEAKKTNGWVLRTYDLSAYAGQTVQLYFGVKGNGYASDFVYQYVDDVSVIGTGTNTPTPSPSPTASATPTANPCGPNGPPTCTPTPTPPSPSPTPTVKPTTSPTPTAKPTTSPTASPTAAPSSTPYPCNDTQFLTDQSEFASGKISADQLVDVCGLVTQVLPSAVTSSGKHGYFYVQIPGGGTIEIVSNLDAMAEASTDKPPSTWPWVAVGNYVFVQGRYYYDNASSQGIDWTEDDTGSWPDVGWVSVCPSGLASCIGGSKYW